MRTALEPFSKELQKVLEMETKENEKKEELVNEVMEKKGSEEVTCEFEDMDFEFIKNLWGKMQGLAGQDEVRGMVIKIDDALKSAESRVFNKVVN